MANIEHRWLLHAPTEDAPRDRMPSVISGPRLPHGELWVVPAEQLTGAVEALAFIRDHEPVNDEGAAAFEQFAHDAKERAAQALATLGGK